MQVSRPVIENPATGERIVLVRTGAETGGALLQFELFLAPGGHVPSSHTHPEQEERFTVLEGRVRFRLGVQVVYAGPGETVTVGAGTAHRFANAGSGTARLLVEVRPALRMEELLETAAALTRSRNRVRARGQGALRARFPGKADYRRADPAGRVARIGRTLPAAAPGRSTVVRDITRGRSRLILDRRERTG
jgi:quercetin dioxygenase-like cupin family protein